MELVGSHGSIFLSVRVRSLLARVLVIMFKTGRPLARWLGFHRVRIGGVYLGTWLRGVLLPRRRFIITSFGARLYSDVHESLTLRLLWEGSYEAGTTRILKQVIRPGMTVMDVGAHIGYYTLLAALQVGPSGKVFAFEPEPSNYALLQRNLVLNDIRNVVAVRRAIMDGRGVARLWLSSKSTSHSVIRGEDSSGWMDVDTISLDDYWASLDWPPVHVVKIDAEGAELAVLRGMREVLRRNREAKLIVEAPFQGTVFGVSLGHMPKWLEEEGFSVYSIDEEASDLDASLSSVLLQNTTSAGVRGYVNLYCERRHSRGIPASRLGDVSDSL